MAECELKNLEGSQSVAGQKAMGVPQLSEFGAPAEMSEGMLLREKNQTEMPLSTHCTARACQQLLEEWATGTCVRKRCALA